MKHIKYVFMGSIFIFEMVVISIYIYTRVKAAAQVIAIIETFPVPSGGDTADDPAIWIHPTEPSLSIIIGTDKKGGLGVYDLQGNQLQYLAIGEINNVDLRYNFPLGGQSIALVTAGNRTTEGIEIFKVNPISRNLEGVAIGDINLGFNPYGSCMYLSPVTGEYYFFVNSKDGEVEQWQLYDNGAGLVEGILDRSLEVGSQTEGCVADDQYGDFYIGEEGVGIWKYGAEPEDGSERIMVDSTGSTGHLAADVEGLTLYYTREGGGYLIASSQGSDEFVIYRRDGDNKYLFTFEVVAGNGIDRVTNTDGIDVTNFNLGPAFPWGLFVVQDGSNDLGNQNFKLIPWQSIANVNFPLSTDTSWDPRRVGANVTAPSLPRWIYIPLIIRNLVGSTTR